MSDWITSLFAHPKTLLAVGATLLALWKYLSSLLWLSKIEGWPTVYGTVDDAVVEEKTGKDEEPYETNLFYSYTVEGSAYRGVYSQNFDDEAEARDFVSRLQGCRVPVHYNSRRSERSGLLPHEVETAASGSTRAGARLEPVIVEGADYVLGPYRLFTLPFFVSGTSGFLCCLVIHLAAVIGRPVDLTIDQFWLMFGGVFTVFFPAILIVTYMQRYEFAKPYFTHPEQFYSDWVPWLLKVLFAYTVFNFFFCTYVLHAASHFSSGDPPPDANTIRSFSGVCLLFYAFSAAMLYVALTARKLRFRCPAGHISETAGRFCPVCGTMQNQSGLQLGSTARRL